MANDRFSQVTVEVLVYPDPKVRLSQMAIEVLTAKASSEPSSWVPKAIIVR